MKLNKKGFGVAEIAIVILLIGILAAAVIAGFMGIKQNAHNAVVSQQEIAESMDHNLKHSFPTILSENLQNGLRIEDENQYEVYELGGYSLKGQGYGSEKYPVYNKGTLYISGNGTLDDSCAIDASYPINATTDNGYVAIENYGKLYLNDLVIKGGGNQRAYRDYYLMCYENSTTELDNVRYDTSAGAIGVLTNANVLIKGSNTLVTLQPRMTSGLTGFNMFVLVYGNVTIEGGTFRMEKDSNTYVLNQGGTVTIKDANFETKFAEIDHKNNYGFRTLYGGTMIIQNGFFDCRSIKSFLNVDSTSTVTISGGEFVCVPSKVVDGGGKVVITGGAFEWNPDAYVDDESGAYTITKTSGYLCRDGQTRTMYVVTKN